MNCGCTIVDNKIVSNCDLHINQLKKNRAAVAALIEARIDRVMKDTFLYEIKDQLITEIRKMRQ